jgi:maleylpyruvate isomerase
MQLHGYFRSSAASRVRIALNLKGLQAEHVFHHLRRGEQRGEDYLRINPQGLIPVLETDDGAVLTQSLAICEWLEETRLEPPLLPGDSLERARSAASRSPSPATSTRCRTSRYWRGCACSGRRSRRSRLGRVG